MRLDNIRYLSILRPGLYSRVGFPSTIKGFSELLEKVLNKTHIFTSHFIQGTRIKGMEMELVWHEKASRTALQTGSLLYTHTILVQTHTHDYSQGNCRTMSSIINKLE